MSVKLKQRFGEVLALVLIVSIVGFLVYMLIPNNPKTPESNPVTVRSTTKVETQPHVAAVTEQTPPSSHALQETAAANVQQNLQSNATNTSNSDANNRNLASKKASQQQNGNAQGSVVSAAAKSACVPLPKSVTKVGSALQSIPIVGGLISDVTNCAT